MPPVPRPVQVSLAPAGSSAMGLPEGQLTATPWSSVTSTLRRGTEPVLLTT